MCKIKNMLVLVIAVMISLFISGCSHPFTEKEIVEDTGKYTTYLGAEGKYKENYVAYNDIFPDSIENVTVKNFFYEYYNPWDACYLGYLVCEYPQEEYEKEVFRLQRLNSTDYMDIYEIQGFHKEVGAIYANDSGFIYALCDSDLHEISYVSIEFCNYFSDIEGYEKIIDAADLPIGLDVSKDNDRRKAFDQKQ